MRKQRPVSPQMTRLLARVVRWRKQGGGGRGSRIPDKLWQEAIGVARREGPYVTAKVTRFNYRRLKEQSGHQGQDKELAAHLVGNKPVGEASQDSVSNQGPGACGGQGGARFIALQVASPGKASTTRIKLVGRHGEQMRIEIAGEVDVVGLVQTMWSRPS